MTTHISYSPNSTWENVKTALSYLVFPKNLLQGNEVQRLEHQFQAITKNRFTYSFGSGRECLNAILQAYNIKAGDEVILQAFTCIVLVNAIKSVGAKPVYVDIKKGSFQMDEHAIQTKVTEKTKAILLTHIFGQIGDLDSYVHIAKKHNLILINDCAQSLGATYKGKSISEYGDITFFSFGRDKIISGVAGGLISTDDESVANHLDTIQKSARLPEKNYVRKQLLHPITASIILPLYNVLHIGKVLLLLLQKFHLLTPVITKSEKKGEMNSLTKLSNAQAHLVNQQLKKLDTFNTQRIQLAELYRKDVKHPHMIHPEIQEGDVFLRYSLLVPTPKTWRLYFKKKGIVLGDWYDQVIGPASADLTTTDYVAGSCPNAEYASRHIINLPTHPKMTQRQAKSIIKHLNKLAQKIPNV